MFGEQKARVGGTGEKFWWTAPVPLVGSPTLQIYLSSGTVTPTFAGIGTTPLITTVARDRKTLTASATVTGSIRGAQGPKWGEAFLISPKDGWFPVQVREISGSTITLAEPLASPLDVSVAAPASLQFALYRGTLTTTMVSAAARDVPWTVKYVEQAGADLSGYTGRDEGLIHIVRQPFGTGLTSRHVAQLHPGLAQRVPRRQGSWDPQIEAALMEMVIHLRADLQARDLTEDDLNGARLRLAHGHLAAAVIYDEVQPEKAELLRARVLGVLDEETGTRAGGMLNESLRSVWLDADRDGAVDEGEMDTIEGARLVDSKSFFTSSSYDSTDRRFSKGERH